MLKLFYIFSLLLITTSCWKVTASTFDFTKPGNPSQRWMYDGPPERTDGKSYDPLYVDGWKDGCATGADGNSNTFYKFMGGFKQDAYKARMIYIIKGGKMPSAIAAGMYINITEG